MAFSATDNYDTRQVKRYTQEAEYYQKKADGYRREAQHYLKKAEGYQREAAYIPGKEIQTGQWIIIVVLIGLWMTIKLKCDMLQMPMKKLLTILNGLQDFYKNRLSWHLYG